MHDLGTLDGTSGGTSGATAINDLGQIVGDSYSIAAGTTHAAYFTHHGVVDLGTLGGFSEATALNNRGQVVGYSNNHAFVTDLSGGPMVDLNTLIPPDSGWDNLFRADGINDAGQIVGSGVRPGYDIVHAYLLTPQNDLVAGLAPAAPASANAAAANVAASTAPSVPLSLLAPATVSCGGPNALAAKLVVSRPVAVLVAIRLESPQTLLGMDPWAPVLGPEN